MVASQFGGDEHLLAAFGLKLAEGRNFLPEEVLDRMFEAFYSTKTDGLGIGLGLCRSIVESHKGRLRAENLYNGELLSGCRFSFTIPVDAKPADTAAHPLMASNP